MPTVRKDEDERKKQRERTNERVSESKSERKRENAYIKQETCRYLSFTFESFSLLIYLILIKQQTNGTIITLISL